MSERAAWEALLARVQEGSGEDRALNADIAVTLGGWQRKWHDSERPHGWYWRRGDYSWTAEGEGYPSNYLGSLDTALTLLTEGYEWLRKTPQTMTVYRIPEDLKEWARHIDGRAATPARALIAACIKAMMEALGD